MVRYQVTVYFKEKTVMISAKNKKDAEKKAYKKILAKKISIDKSLTDVESGFWGRSERN